MHISEVCQYGRKGKLCSTVNVARVSDLLKCSLFGNCPVKAFVPSHLSCTRGVDTRSEVLTTFASASIDGKDEIGIGYGKGNGVRKLESLACKISACDFSSFLGADPD